MNCSSAIERSACVCVQNLTTLYPKILWKKVSHVKCCHVWLLSSKWKKISIKIKSAMMTSIRNTCTHTKSKKSMQNSDFISKKSLEKNILSFLANLSSKLPNSIVQYQAFYLPLQLWINTNCQNHETKTQDSRKKNQVKNTWINNQ